MRNGTRKTQMPKRKCSIPGCGRDHHALGLCSADYSAQKYMERRRQKSAAGTQGPRSPRRNRPPLPLIPLGKLNAQKTSNTQRPPETQKSPAPRDPIKALNEFAQWAINETGARPSGKP